jgi:REP element-mobilizing transposase RayT
MMMKPGEKHNISKIMQCLKRHTSRNANIIMGYNDEISNNPKDKIGCINSKAETRCPEGEIGQSRLLGRSFDIVVKKLRDEFLQKHGTRHNFPPFQWQRSFYDHYVRDETDFENHYDYILNNPHKHGLGPKWKYTSKNFPELLDSDW